MTLRWDHHQQGSRELLEVTQIFQSIDKIKMYIEIVDKLIPLYIIERRNGRFCARLSPGTVIIVRITSHAPLFCHNTKFDTAYRCRCTNSNRYADQILSLSLPDFVFLLPALSLCASNYGGNITPSLHN